MTGNVLSWGVALAKGFQPGQYSYTEVPLGEYEATLDFKIWAKKIMGINCYFTKAVTGQNFQLTVYCKHRTGIYKIEGCSIDFTQCHTAKTYQVTVFKNEKGKIVFASAKVL